MLAILNLLGEAVFAASGAIAAGRRRMDVLGAIVLAIVTAIGGGTIRDLLLERHPVFWIADPNHLLVAIGGALVTLAYVAFRKPPDDALAIADALGLALFTIAGAQIAEERHVGGVVTVLMATITGVAGGVIRDVLSAEVPLVLKRGELYASAAIGGAALYLLLQEAGVSRNLAAVAGMATIVGVRFAAILWGLKLPIPRIRDQ
jgi:uncharacterized membrane protein YeiH